MSDDSLKRKEGFDTLSYQFSIDGHCDICDEAVVFNSKHDWFRDHLLCSNCGSIPRERALMRVIKQVYPNFKELSVHESSPGTRGASEILKRDCADYSSSQYFPDLASGEMYEKYNQQCQNLEAMSLADQTFDLFVTQDVMEHLYNPAAAFREIARVLKPGGAHIFTVPIVNKWKATELRAILGEDGEIIHLMEPQYHGNPVTDEGILMTYNWGYDIAAFIDKAAGTNTVIMQIDDIEHGIRADLIEVLVSKKQ
ncbi:MAG: class I SAM-dependent methyltransferase [Robiginitomaculum sp.]|nr:class I SAM-dependent methyltransferase [Robiginitomaculum sp.]